MKTTPLPWAAQEDFALPGLFSRIDGPASWAIVGLHGELRSFGALVRGESPWRGRQGQHLAPFQRRRRKRSSVYRL